MTSSAPSLTAHWGPKGPARADRKVRGLPVPSRLRTGVREARATERANEERKREEEPPERETPAFPRTDQAHKAWRKGRAEGKERRREKAKVVREAHRTGDGDWLN